MLAFTVIDICSKLDKLARPGNQKTICAKEVSVQRFIDKFKEGEQAKKLSLHSPLSPVRPKHRKRAKYWN